MLYILTGPPTDDGSAQITFQPVTAEMAKKEPGPRLHAVVSPVKDTLVTELPGDFAEDSVSELTVQGIRLHAAAENLAVKDAGPAGNLSGSSIEEDVELNASIATSPQSFVVEDRRRTSRKTLMETLSAFQEEETARPVRQRRQPAGDDEL